ncbi:MAG: HAD hydrolase family protein [Candidatus Wildermuthbacteria bacterium]|nr:HAD hydrolase family protein [Candidatus Wildermuthbacteria bacterium]
MPLIAAAFDVDGSIMVQGGPCDPKVAEVFRILSGAGLKLGPATGKNCDFGRGLGCGVGVTWDFVIGESGAQILETLAKNPPAYRQRTVVGATADLSFFARAIDLDPFLRNFLFYGDRVSYRPELKESILTLFPPGKNIEATEDWVPYFWDIVKTFRLRLKVQRHSEGGIDVLPTTVNKELGIAEVCKMYGCEPKDILVVVDGMNDAELMRGTRVIAVGNAVPQIKELASQLGGFVATLPDGEGFIEGLRHYAGLGSFAEDVNKIILEKIHSE